MTTEAVALIPEPASTPSLEVVPDLPVEVTIAEIAAGVTTALVEAWNAIRAHHPDVPEAVVSMATGGRTSAVELAHFAPRRWRLRDSGDLHHEVFVTAESLDRGAPDVFGSLLHEAAHAMNEARGIKDCSASQYHNKHFRAAAEELGLTEPDGISEKWRKKYGFAGYGELSEETSTSYANQIAALDKAMHATRRPDGFSTSASGGGKSGTTGSEQEDGADAGGDGEAATTEKKKEERNYVKAVCQCEPATVIRVSPKTLERRTIKCGDCDENFELEARA